MKIDISSEMQDHIVVETLVEQIENFNCNISRLENLGELRPHQKGDLYDDKKTRRDAIRLLRHFLTWEDFSARVIPLAPDYWEILKKRAYCQMKIGKKS